MNAYNRTRAALSALVAAGAVACSDSTVTPPPDPDPDGPLELRAAWGEAGNGPGQFELANDVAVAPDRTVYVVDGSTTSAQAFSADGEFLFAWDVHHGDDSRSQFAFRIEVGGDGRVYVVNRSILIYTPDGQLVAEWKPADDDSGFQDVADIAVAANGIVYVASRDFIYKLDPDGNVVQRRGGYGEDDGLFRFLATLDVLPDGTVAAADDNPNRVQFFTPDGVFLRSWTLRAGTHAVRDLATEADGDMYVSLIRTGNVDRFSPSGEFEFGLDSHGEDAVLLRPNGIAVDRDGNLYVASTNRIQKFSPSI